MADTVPHPDAVSLTRPGWFPGRRAVVRSIMTSGALVLITFAVFAWGVFSGRLERYDVTAPMAFVLVGLALGGFAGSHLEADSEAVTALTEATLVWVLFSDASRVGLRELRHDAGVFVRLLALGLPLTVAAGSFAAWWLLDLPDPWLALLAGAALAPTDAALGSVVVTNPAVPSRIRRILNVESGLNDGIVTPIVMFAVFSSATHGVLPAVLQLAGGAVIGAALGAGGGRLLRTAQARGWADQGFAGPAVVALALLAYGGSTVLHANGFVAAFVAGLAFGHVVPFVEQTAALASLLVWTLFGAIAVPLLPSLLSPAMILYALLSLTVIRMAPVAISLIGAQFDTRTVLFIGWFGPRGLASIVFALLAIEELGPSASPVVAVIVLTVLLSVVAHGLSARPLALQYPKSSV
ncbi:sodium:proton antiporter [Actinoplanes sp. OR16]|uniref:cation:proton antiporter n=1 Tax=Actinoplanes sp. OR16 TaxID=946334 RepID=UPI001E4B167F|nr:cation:proton antiporter [Actinoplanes sp. OR16]